MVHAPGEPNVIEDQTCRVKKDPCVTADRLHAGDEVAALGTAAFEAELASIVESLVHGRVVVLPIYHELGFRR